ncbi:MAG: DUF6386 family protein [Planctomycetota bacterium]
MKPVPFETDLGTLAVFDPKAIAHRTRQPKTWWREGSSVLEVPEVLEGKLALFPIGKEGRYSCRLSLDGVLTEVEQKLVKGKVGTLGIHLGGEDIFCGAAERLPGDGVGDRVMNIPDTGAYWKADPGEYDVSVHVIDWRTNRDFFDEDGEPLPTAPPDFVVVLSKRAQPFDAPLQLALLLDLIERAEASAAALYVPKVVRRTVSVSPRPGRSAHSSSAEPEYVEVVEEPPAPPAFGPLDPALVRRAFRDIIEAKELKVPGTSIAQLLLKPRDTSLQPKEIDVDDFLGKLTRVRNEMRVLEQKVNAKDGLEDEERLNLDSYVTAVYVACARLAEVLA